MTQPPRHLSQAPHRRLAWLQQAACASDSDGCAPFFVSAGHVLDRDLRDRCRYHCPVRVECVWHAYFGGVDGTPIEAGYLAGFSPGERKTLTVQEALARVAQDRSGELTPR